MEFSYHAQGDFYTLISGREGRTDWCRNAGANPRVSPRVDGLERAAIAERLPALEVAKMGRELTGMNPSARWIWERWSGVVIDGTEAGLMAAAPHFPALHLRPTEAAAG